MNKALFIFLIVAVIIILVAVSLTSVFTHNSATTGTASSSLQTSIEPPMVQESAP